VNEIAQKFKVVNTNIRKEEVKTCFDWDRYLGKPEIAVLLRECDKIDIHWNSTGFLLH
jgi:hypothetical protein